MRRDPLATDIEALITAARSVVSDTSSMAAEGEYFGPFSEGRLGFGRNGEEYFVEWPNLAISIERLNHALKAIGRGL